MARLGSFYGVVGIILLLFAGVAYFITRAFSSYVVIPSGHGRPRGYCLLRLSARIGQRIPRRAFNEIRRPSCARTR